MQHVIAILTAQLELYRTNEPIHRAEGRIDQADLGLATIAELERAIDWFTGNLDALFFWFSVDEAKPDSDIAVVVATNKGEVDSASYDGTGNDWKWTCGSPIVESEVTHWTHFPEHPEA